MAKTRTEDARFGHRPEGSTAPVPFDLNIEKVLEDWGVEHGIREVIANALDEQALTDTKDIEVGKDNQGRWHIRDYGRGLRQEHLTQNENQEKLKHPAKVIGKFGVGLKDALATFDRNKVKVRIDSRFVSITLAKAAKHGFDLITLHALVSPPADRHMVGTDVILEGISDEHMERAKRFFLKFSSERLLETTPHGQVLDKYKAPTARIYITGLLVAEEADFLCSYNITNVTKAIRKALNRERTNVGRAAYTDRIKAILLACRQARVAELLVQDLKHFGDGTLHDELKWLDVAVHACKLLNAAQRVIFLTPRELVAAATFVEYARQDGCEIITIPEDVKGKLRGETDYEGNAIRDLGGYIQEWNKSFKFQFVEEADLSKSERQVFRTTPVLFKLIGGRPPNVKHVKISETMRMESFSYHEAEGVWDAKTGSIIVKRDQLKSRRLYAGTLLHEVGHALSGAGDVTADFEKELTSLLGIVADKAAP